MSEAMEQAIAWLIEERRSLEEQLDKVNLALATLEPEPEAVVEGPLEEQPIVKATKAKTGDRKPKTGARSKLFKTDEELAAAVAKFDLSQPLAGQFMQHHGMARSNAYKWAAEAQRLGLTNPLAVLAERERADQERRNRTARAAFSS